MNDNKNVKKDDACASSEMGYRASNRNVSDLDLAITMWRIWSAVMLRHSIVRNWELPSDFHLARGTRDSNMAIQWYFIMKYLRCLCDFHRKRDLMDWIMRTICTRFRLNRKCNETEENKNCAGTSAVRWNRIEAKHNIFVEQQKMNKNKVTKFEMM